MVQPISRANLLSYGIDTAERALVFTALLLRQQYLLLNDRNLSDSFQITPQLAFKRNAVTQIYEPAFSIAIRATLYYDIAVLSGGGDIMQRLVPKSNGTAYYDGIAVPESTVLLVPLPEEDTSESLEAQFYYFAQLYHDYFLQNITGDTTITELNYVSLLPQFRGSSTEGSVTVTATVSADYQTYLSGNNLVGAVGVGTANLPFGNEVQLGNDYQLTN